MERERIIVIDLDGCLCEKRTGETDYADVAPVEAVADRLREYRRKGFYVILHTSRNMNTYDNNLGRINANTAPTILDWLDRHRIEYDEIYFGKPWCGFRGFYVDDRAIRPSEFVTMGEGQIVELLDREQEKLHPCPSETSGGRERRREG